MDSLLEHLDTAGMAETFVRIVGADEQAVPNLPPESLAWISEMDIIARLLARSASSTRTTLDLLIGIPGDFLSLIMTPHIPYA